MKTKSKDMNKQQMKLSVDEESMNIYIDNGEDKEPTHILYYHIDEWEEDATVVISMLNAMTLFYTDKKELLKVLGIKLG